MNCLCVSCTRVCTVFSIVSGWCHEWKQTEVVLAFATEFPLWSVECATWDAPCCPLAGWLGVESKNCRRATIVFCFVKGGVGLCVSCCRAVWTGVVGKKNRSRAVGLSPSVQSGRGRARSSALFFPFQSLSFSIYLSFFFFFLILSISSFSSYSFVLTFDFFPPLSPRVHHLFNSHPIDNPHSFASYQFLIL